MENAMINIKYTRTIITIDINIYYIEIIIKDFNTFKKKK